MNIISDVAGEYVGLKRLMAKMPDEKFLFVGDLIDRGPQSPEVVEEAMNHTCIMANHEHMAVDFFFESGLYEPEIWLYNGGVATLKAYGGKVNADHIRWMMNNPDYYEDEKVFVSHAPWHEELTLDEAKQFLTDKKEINPFSLIWNRHNPKERDKLQIFGHNSPWGLKYFGDMDHPWAVCLDASRKRVLTGLHVPTMTIYQEPYDV